MATTTNYGWTTPNDTDLVKDGAAAIRTLGSSVDTTTKALNPSTTLGDIEYRSATANTNTRLGIGTTGQVLTVAGGVPTWAAAGGGGKVLQVVEGSTTTTASNSTTTFATTNLSASITPSSVSSKVLVLVNQAGCGKNATSNDNELVVRLLKGATVLASHFAGYTGSAIYNIVGTVGFNYLDSPSTTSSITYSTEFKNNTASSAVFVQGSSSYSSIILMEIGV